MPLLNTRQIEHLVARLNIDASIEHQVARLNICSIEHLLENQDRQEPEGSGEQRLGELDGVEHHQVLHTLPQTHQLHRDVQLVLHGHHDAALG